jgi:GAF domain-containing protein
MQVIKNWRGQELGAVMDRLEILESVRNLIAKLPNATSLLTEVAKLLHRECPQYHWVGFYLLQGEELLLGPFEGKSTLHTRISLSQGICGAAASSGETVIVDDVNADPRYLACSLETRSEIVVPIFNQGRILGEIDIDQPAAFTAQDRELLETVAALIAHRYDTLQ